MNLLLQLFVNGIINASLFGLLAIGFGIVYRSLRFFHIAYGGIYVSSAYGIVALMKLTSIGGISFFSILLGLSVGIILGMLMDRSVYHPLEKRGASKSVLFIASLGIYIVVVNIIALIFGSDVKVISKGIEPSFSFFNLIAVSYTHLTLPTKA